MSRVISAGLSFTAQDCRNTRKKGVLLSSKTQKPSNISFQGGFYQRIIELLMPGVASQIKSVEDYMVQSAQGAKGIISDLMAYQVDPSTNLVAGESSPAFKSNKLNKIA